MFMEYGLTAPRFRLGSNRHKTPIPRSGGELYYLKEIISKPPFLAVCLYGVAFVLLGNVATNSMSFGVRVLQAAGRTDPVSQWSTTDNWIARGLALLVVTFTCGIHAGWRLGGIYLNNAFAIVKLAMLLFIFITGCLTWGGVFHRSPDATSNLNSSVAFDNPSKDAYAFAEAYLAVVFAFGGFNQANYVSGSTAAGGLPLTAQGDGRNRSAEAKVQMASFLHGCRRERVVSTCQRGIHAGGSRRRSEVREGYRR